MGAGSLTRDELRLLEEIFVYVNLIDAMTAVLILYEDWRISDEKAAQSESELEEILARLNDFDSRLACVERELADICDKLF